MEQPKEEFEESEKINVTIVVASDFCDCATVFDHACKRINEEGFAQSDHLF